MRRWRLGRRRSERIAESQAAIEQQERVGEVIEWQRAEVAEVSAWARERLQLNHLTELFLTNRGGHS